MSMTHSLTRSDQAHGRACDLYVITSATAAKSCCFRLKHINIYIPAYLVALVHESGEELYLNGVLDSLWYERYPPFEDRSRIRDHFDPNKSLEQTLHEIGIQMPHLTDQERKAAGETRVSIAKKAAYSKETTGHDYLEPSTSYRRMRWEERMPLLTKPAESVHSTSPAACSGKERQTDPTARASGPCSTNIGVLFSWSKDNRAKFNRAVGNFVGKAAAIITTLELRAWFGAARTRLALREKGVRGV